ncbi:MAG: ABC1 kinase family protein [Bradymonadia bacterium]
MKGDVPTAAWRRNLLAGQGAARVASDKALASLARPFRSAESQARADAALDAKTADRIFEVLSRLRGSALKVAQFFSMETDLVSPEMAKRLRQTCDRVPMMNSAFVRTEVRRALGHSPNRMFVQFDHKAMAAASIGQVHAATTHDGRSVVVKVQYPGIEQTIINDMRTLSRLIRLTSNSSYLLSLVDEVKARLLEECDYHLEAEQLAWFAAHGQIEGVSTPEPVPELSSSRVLTMTRMSGEPLCEWLQGDPSQAQRERVAGRVHQVFVDAIRRHGRLHADSNPGNFLFTDDKVSVLDFGCVRALSEDYRDLVLRLWRTFAHPEPSELWSLYEQMGLFKNMPTHEAEAMEAEHLLPFREWLAEPLRVERFDFGADPDFISRGRDLFFSFIKHRAHLGLRSEFVLVNRALFGMYRLFEQLGARVSLREAWLES